MQANKTPLLIDRQSRSASFLPSVGGGGTAITALKWLGIIAVGVAVFYFLGLPAIERAQDLNDTSQRLGVAECHILAHATIGEARYVLRGASSMRRPIYLSGFRVSYALIDQGRPDVEVANATLLTNINVDKAWLFAWERAALWERYPIGSRVTCYYDDSNRERTSLIDDLDDQIGWQVALAIVSALPVALCLCLLAVNAGIAAALRARSAQKAIPTPFDDPLPL
jgi:hypothetical protein